MDAWLEQQDGTRLPIADGFSIGRGADNQLPLPDERASRRHALIHDRGNEGFWLVDLGSRNGTYRNNRRVQQSVRLRDGDSIQVGSTQFTFRQPGGTEPPSTTAGPAQQTIWEVRSEDCWLLIGDLVSSTQFVQKLGLEQASALIAEWLQHCRRAVEASGGIVNKFLGDGFFAFWRATANPSDQVFPCLEGLRQRQRAGDPRFRLVLHRGRVQIGGGVSLGEDNLSGPEVNFAFRMEKLAGSLGEEILLSEAAATACQHLWPVEEVGGHALSGFEGVFRFFRFCEIAPGKKGC
jgi:adenylate cyclase